MKKNVLVVDLYPVAGSFVPDTNGFSKAMNVIYKEARKEKPKENCRKVIFDHASEQTFFGMPLAKLVVA